jgi:hypothetical protein
LTTHSKHTELVFLLANTCTHWQLVVLLPGSLALLLPLLLLLLPCAIFLLLLLLLN